MSNVNDSYINALLEQIRDEIRSIHEAAADVPKRSEFDELRRDVAELKHNTHVLTATMSYHHTT